VPRLWPRVDGRGRTSKIDGVLFFCPSYADLAAEAVPRLRLGETPGETVAAEGGSAARHPRSRLICAESRGRARARDGRGAMPSPHSNW
jgi:hypothetical protein